MKNKQKYQIIFLLILALLCIQRTEAQKTWSFDQPNALISSDGDSPLILHSLRENPEIVEGIKGNALRTDGYTTWLARNFIPSEPIKGISGWFALESYPTDTAAFFGVANFDKKQAISLCVDRFGELMLHFTQDTDIYIPVQYKVKKFEWVNLAMSFDKENILLFVNGNKINVEGSVKPSLTLLNFDELIVARDFRNKELFINDLTAINGIIDEIKVWKNHINPSDIKQEVRGFSDKKPTLAIPHSRFEGDFSRPKYHLLPAANWTNETHGLLYFNERYHIFNQKNASNMFLDQINWGHFSSPDLVNWTEHKPAITPEPGYDSNGAWSGHVVVDNEGMPTLIYTAGGDKMGVAIAFPKDIKDPTLTEWIKYEHNPVISGQPEGCTRNDLRDEYVWKEGDNWYMIVGFGVVENNVEKGAVLLYKSKDLKKWDFIHTMFEGNPSVDDSGIFWEMPVFWKYGDKYILLVNKVPHNRTPARAMYWSGSFVNERFIPDDAIPRNLEVVNRLLSPSVSYDKDGNITAIAIIPDEIGSWAAYKHGWTHLYSIPRIWNIDNGIIKQSAHPALRQLRGDYETLGATIVRESTPIKISSDDQQLEVKATINPKASEKFGFIIHRNPDNSEYTKIYYDTRKEEIVVDQTHSSIKEFIPLNIRTGKYKLDVSKPVDFHVFIDRSVVEIFINDTDAFTTRIFPLSQNSSQLNVFTEGGDIEVNADIWKLNGADMQSDF